MKNKKITINYGSGMLKYIRKNREIQNIAIQFMGEAIKLSSDENVIRAQQELALLSENFDKILWDFDGVFKEFLNSDLKMCDDYIIVSLIFGENVLRLLHVNEVIEISMNK